MANLRQLTHLRLLSPKAYTTSQTGSAVDMQGYINPGGRNVKATISSGEMFGTAISLAAKLQESDTTTSADFADITGGGFTTISATTGGLETIHPIVRKRYIRAVTTQSSNTTSVSLSISVLAENRVT